MNKDYSRGSVLSKVYREFGQAVKKMWDKIVKALNEAVAKFRHFQQPPYCIANPAKWKSPKITTEFSSRTNKAMSLNAFSRRWRHSELCW